MEIVGRNPIALCDTGTGHLDVRRGRHPWPEGYAVAALVVRTDDTVLVRGESGYESPALALERAEILAAYDAVADEVEGVFDPVIEAYRHVRAAPEGPAALSAAHRALAYDRDRSRAALERVGAALERVGAPHAAALAVVTARALADWDAAHPAGAPELVEGTPDGDDWTCLCGNDTGGDGFWPVQGGRWTTPDARGPWDGRLVGCAGCGRVIDQATCAVVGRLDDAALREPLPD